MKIGQVTKLDKRKQMMSKKVDDTSWREIMTSLSYLQFMASLEQFGSRIPDA